MKNINVKDKYPNLYEFLSAETFDGLQDISEPVLCICEKIFTSPEKFTIEDGVFTDIETVFSMYITEDSGLKWLDSFLYHEYTIKGYCSWTTQDEESLLVDTFKEWRRRLSEVQQLEREQEKLDERKKMCEAYGVDYE